MNTQNIKQYVEQLNIGPDSDFVKLKKDLASKLTENDDNVSETMEALEELTVEINERLDLVTDEERAEGLKRNLKLVEETSAEIADIAAKKAAEPEKVKSVLIADDSQERVEDLKKTLPVAIDESSKTAAGDKKEAEKEKEKDLKDSSGKSDIFSLKDKLFGQKTDQDKLEKEAGELIKEKKKELKEQEKEQKRLEKEQEKNTRNDSADAGGDQTGDDKKSSDNENDNKKSVPGFLQKLGFGSSSDTMDPQLAGALSLYHKQNYSQARDQLKQLSNSKTISKSDLGTSRFLYGLMLERGEGGPVDKDASEFWIKEAARVKNVDALLYLGGQYAEKTPSNNVENVEITEKALKCFEKADKAQEGGNDTAKLKYIDVCEAKPIYRSAKNRACDYCDDLSDKKTDAYEKKQFADRKERIKLNYKQNGAAKFSGGGVLINNPRDIFVLLGALFTLVSDLYIFMSIQNKGSVLPNVLSQENYYPGDSSLMGKLAERVADVMGIGEFTVIVPATLLMGMIMFAAGRFMTGLERYSSRGKVTEVVCEISAAATLLTIFGNCLMYMFVNGSILYLITAVMTGVLMAGITAVMAIITSFIRK